MPENVTDWRRDHFYRARRDGDQRLRDAVEHLGKQFAGATKGGADDKAAKLLTNLLRFEEPKTTPPGGAATDPSGKPVPGGSPYPRPGAPGNPPGGYRPGPSGGYRPGPSGYPSPGGYPGQPGTGQNAPLDPIIIKAIVQALAVNDSKTARGTLNEVLRGTFKSDDDRAATEGLLEALVGLPSPEHENVLFRVLTNPDQIRPAPRDQSQPGSASGRPSPYPGKSGYPGSYGPSGYSGAPKPSGYYGKSGPSGYPGPSGSPYGGYSQPGQGKMTGAEMQSVAVALVDQIGSQAFRTKLADHIAQSTTADDVRQALLPMLSAVHPQNLPAQTILYRSEALDPGNRALLEGYFVKYSSAALAMLLRVPEASPSRSSGGTTPQGPSAPYGPAGPNRPYGPGRGPAGGPRPSYPGNSDRSRPQTGLALLAVQDQGSSDLGPSRPPAGTRGYGPPGAGAGAQQRPRPGGPPGAPYPGPGGPAYPGGPAPGSSYGAAATLSGPLEAIPGFDREAITGLAAPLWATEFVKVVQTRLDALESLETDGGAIVLASTIPTDTVRTKVYRLLERHYLHQSPQGLEAAGLAGDVLSDPGLLVTMKLLPRKEAPKPRANPPRTRDRDRKGSSRGEQSTGPGPAGGPSGPGQSPQQPATPGEEWTGTAERLVRALCERLAAAGKSARGSAEVAEKRPVEIPRSGVQILSEYHLQWPDDLSDKSKLSGVSLDPMTIHYVRYQYQEASTINKVLAFYRQKLGSPKPAERTAAAGMWLESLRTVADKTGRLSVDVLISRAADVTRPGPSGRGGADAGYGPPTGPGGKPKPPAYGPGYGPGYGSGKRGGDSDSSRGGGQSGAGTARERNEPTELIVEVLAVQTNDFAASQEAAEPAAAQPEAAKEKP